MSTMPRDMTIDPTVRSTVNSNRKTSFLDFVTSQPATSLERFESSESSRFEFIHLNRVLGRDSARQREIDYSWAAWR